MVTKQFHCKIILHYFCFTNLLCYQNYLCKRKLLSLKLLGSIQVSRTQIWSDFWAYISMLRSTKCFSKDLMFSCWSPPTIELEKWSASDFDFRLGMKWSLLKKWHILHDIEYSYYSCCFIFVKNCKLVNHLVL